MKWILVLVFLFSGVAFGQSPQTKPFSIDGADGGTIKGDINAEDITATGDVTATGDLSGEDINVGGVWLLEVQNCTGQPTDSCCYNGTQLICKKSDDETVDALVGSGSGQWSVSGSDISYSTGLVSIGSTTDGDSQFLITTPSGLGVVQSFKVLNEKAIAGINAAMNLTLTGASTTNRGLYIWSVNGTSANYSIYAARGVGYFEEGIEFKGTITSLDDDGEHYVNFSNTIGFSGTPVEGDITCNSTTNVCTIRFDSAWIYVTTRIFTAVEPGNPCVEGEPDRFYTTTDTLYICQGTVWHFETFAD